MPAPRPAAAVVPAAKRRRGNTRTTGKEQFYTPRELADELMAQVAEVVGDLSTRTVLEPAGGSGAFIDAALRAGVTALQSWDIEPHHSSVKRGDFLRARIGVSGAVTISNPPFGRNNALSIPFFNRAAEHSDYIAFIVPRSWRKWSVVNRLDRHFWKVADSDIQVDYVDANNQPLMQRKRLNTCFQIWERRAELRPLYVVEDRGLVTKVAPAEADVALTTFGFGCGTVRTEFDRVPNSTRIFLKLNHPDALRALQTVDYSKFFRHTAYTEAVGLQEINFLLNEAIFGDPGLVERA